MAARARADDQVTPAAAAATVLASTIMGWRVVVLAALIHVAILPRLLPVVVVMTIVGVVAAYLFSRSSMIRATPATKAPLANPFSLTKALGFGAGYALILLSARAAQESYGVQGTYVAAAVAVLADVDAVTIAITRLGAVTQSWQAPATAVTMPTNSHPAVPSACIASVVMGPSFARARSTTVETHFVVSWTSTIEAVNGGSPGGSQVSPARWFFLAFDTGGEFSRTR